MSQKKSKQRDAILEAVKSTKSHPDAEWVYETVRKKIPNISLGTVYRNLSKMAEDKTITRVLSESGTGHFDGDLSKHHHIMCRNCGKIDDITSNIYDSVLDSAKDEYDGEVNDFNILFYGLCKNCLDNK